jgi:hypothetical protein
MPTQDTVIAIFRELAGDRAERLEGSRYLADVNTRITEALSDAKTDDEKSLLRKDSIGFHLSDWQREAAFLVAISLFPERFTDEEIREEVDSFLIHAPAHVIEATRLGGYSTENIFLEDTNAA